MYYRNGNDEAFAHACKPQGVDEKSANLVGAGLASLAAASFFICDRQMAGNHITVLEAANLAGSAMGRSRVPRRDSSSAAICCASTS